MPTINKRNKTALITGISGQDGSYLAELLLSKGYKVHGIVRKIAFENPTFRLGRISHIFDKIILHPGSIENYANVFTAVEKSQPDECYHLAAQSFVSYSFKDSFSTLTTNINGTHYLLEALRLKAPKCKFYFAATSEMFGNSQETPQNESTPFNPRSPYGVSKLTGFHLTKNYREAYNMFACSGILFNHESPRRGLEFVTRKITNGVAKIKLGKLNSLELGNLHAERDWGHARDYVKAMWLMLQGVSPCDYVISTGKTHSILEFVKLAFNVVNFTCERYVTINKKFFRPAEVNFLCGDSSLAREYLQWKPEISFNDMVSEMVLSDLRKENN